MLKPVTIIFLLTLAPVTLLAAQVESYQKRYETYMQERAAEKSPFTEQDMAVMKQASLDLQQQLPNPGIKVGQKAPDFQLPNAFGDKVSLSEQLKNGPVVLVFYRGAWCPFCNMHLHVLQKSLPEFHKYDAQLIAITPQRPDKSEAQINKNNYPFEVLSDLNNLVMQAYKLFFTVPDDLISIYKKVGLDIESYNGKGRNGLPVPGTFVIDRQGIVIAMHADTDYKKRMEPAMIIDALRSL